MLYRFTGSKVLDSDPDMQEVESHELLFMCDGDYLEYFETFIKEHECDFGDIYRVSPADWHKRECTEDLILTWEKSDAD
jgi:hypothetical protein